MISVIVLIYLAVSLFFMNRYYPGTMIGDFSCGGKTQAEVEGMIRNRASGYTLKIQGREEMEATLVASEIQLQFLLDNTLQEIIDRQNGFAWLPALWETINYDLPVTVQYDNTLLHEKLSGMLFFQTENMRQPVNAYIGEYNPELGAYPIVEEDKGTVINKQKAEAAIITALENMEETLILDESDCYMKPEISHEDEKLVRFVSRLNRFVSSRIIYDWHGMEEVIDGELIQEWLEIDREQQLVTINATAVRDYINALSQKHDTFGKAREFRTSEGRKITLKPGSYGWRVDRSKETEKLIKLIRAGSQVNREPEYLYMAAAKGENDIGDSYVEINLTAQHLYLYVEGKLITESDFVSGNVSRGFATPDGVYGLTYKTLNATLRGPGYATPVDFWMPFNGNIGMHDAGWRRQFGGNIYLRNGSHGCINLPREEAEKIYEAVYKGFPVVCYKDENSANAGKKNPGGTTSKPTDQNTVPDAGVGGNGIGVEGGIIPVDPNGGIGVPPGTVPEPGVNVPAPDGGVDPGLGTEVTPGAGVPGNEAGTNPGTQAPVVGADGNVGGVPGNGTESSPGVTPGGGAESNPAVGVPDGAGTPGTVPVPQDNPGAVANPVPGA